MISSLYREVLETGQVAWDVATVPYAVWCDLWYDLIS